MTSAASELVRGIEPAPPPRVSIVLPVRDGARYLAQAIESVRAQSLCDWELVAVDDGSTDETPAILARFAAEDPRIRVVRNAPARRLPGALNRGFEETRAPFLTWTSDDNVLLERALETLLTALESDTEADVAYSDYSIVDADGRLVESKGLPSIEHLGYANMVGPSFLFRRRVHEALRGYAEDLFLAEDYDFWLRAVARFRFRHVPVDLYRYRVHPAALGTSRRAEVLRATEEALSRNVAALPRKVRHGAYTRIADIRQARGDSTGATAARQGAFRAAPLREARAWLRRRLRPRPPPSAAS